MTLTPLTSLAAAKWTFAARRVDRTVIAGIDDRFDQAVTGDLILAQVMQLGQHQRVPLILGRPSAIYPGDMVVLACGARYAPDQFKGLARIDPQGADLLAGGGCIGQMTARNERIKPATRLLPIGRLCDARGQVVNLPALACRTRRAGYKVAALKGTGGFGFGDLNEYADTGAHLVADPWLRARQSGLVFACGDAVAAAGGVTDLACHGLRPDALTGLLSCSPMAVAEANLFALRALEAGRQVA